MSYFECLILLILVTASFFFFVGGPEGYAGKLGKQMKISLPLRRYAGAGMKYMPANWPSYRFVNLDIYSEYEKPLSLTVRVHDERHQTVKPTYLFNDRFNKRFKLVKGWNKI